MTAANLDEVPIVGHSTVQDSVALTASIPVTPHREPAEVVVAAFGSDVARGLSRAEVRRRSSSTGRTG
jgi:hypothetical protein